MQTECREPKLYPSRFRPSILIGRGGEGGVGVHIKKPWYIQTLRTKTSQHSKQKIKVIIIQSSNTPFSAGNRRRAIQTPLLIKRVFANIHSSNTSHNSKHTTFSRIEEVLGQKEEIHMYILIKSKSISY